jgi:F0F1-type ATP synthase assembly protein I
MFDYKKNRAWAENLSIVLQIGLTMVGCVAFCFFVGLKLDRWLGLKGIGVTVMTLLGVVGGGNVVYRQITDLLGPGERQGRKKPPPSGEE